MQGTSVNQDKIHKRGKIWRHLFYIILAIVLILCFGLLVKGYDSSNFRQEFRPTYNATPKNFNNTQAQTKLELRYDNKIPNQEAVVERFLQRQNELNKLNRELKSESTNSHPEIDEAISRGIEKLNSMMATKYGLTDY